MATRDDGLRSEITDLLLDAEHRDELQRVGVWAFDHVAKSEATGQIAAVLERRGVAPPPQRCLCQYTQSTDMSPLIARCKARSRLAHSARNQAVSSDRLWPERNERLADSTLLRRIAPPQYETPAWARPSPTSPLDTPFAFTVFATGTPVSPRSLTGSSLGCEPISTTASPQTTPSPCCRNTSSHARSSRRSLAPTPSL